MFIGILPFITLLFAQGLGNKDPDIIDPLLLAGILQSLGAGSKGANDTSNGNNQSAGQVQGRTIQVPSIGVGAQSVHSNVSPVDLSPLQSLLLSTPNTEENKVVGLDNKIDGKNNSVFGNINHIFGVFNSLQGDNNALQGQSNNIWGVSNKVSGILNKIAGDNNRGMGEKNQLVGNTNYVLGSQNAALGHSNSLIGQNNYVWGSGNNIQGTRNTAAGLGNQVIGDSSVVKGIWNNNAGDQNVILGRGNQVIGANNQIGTGFTEAVSSKDFQDVPQKRPFSIGLPQPPPPPVIPPVVIPQSLFRSYQPIRKPTVLPEILIQIPKVAAINGNPPLYSLPSSIQTNSEPQNRYPIQSVKGNNQDSSKSRVIWTSTNANTQKQLQLQGYEYVRLADGRTAIILNQPPKPINNQYLLTPTPPISHPTNYYPLSLAPYITPQPQNSYFPSLLPTPTYPTLSLPPFQKSNFFTQWI